MGLKPRKRKPKPKVVVQVRPTSEAPGWWPTVREIALFATLIPDGGWTLGFDPNHTVLQSKFEDVIHDWFDEYHDIPKTRWEFLIIPI